MLEQTSLMLGPKLLWRPEIKQHEDCRRAPRPPKEKNSTAPATARERQHIISGPPKNNKGTAQPTDQRWRKAERRRTTKVEGMHHSGTALKEKDAIARPTGRHAAPHHPPKERDGINPPRHQRRNEAPLKPREKPDGARVLWGLAH